MGFAQLAGSNAQSFITAEVAKAIVNKSRTEEGVPGENYFQNRSEYIIEVRFDPETGKLSGNADISYFNNSRDTLNKIVLRLYQNIARKGGLRDEEIPQEDIHSGVIISRLKVNGTNYDDQVSHKAKTSATNMRVTLMEPLMPDDSVQLEIAWSFTMPSNHLHRFGKYEGNNYFVAFWYPQVAVYDDINGWDRYNYTGTQEFYNDFSSFDVHVQVPKNFIVLATGELQNANEIFSDKVVSRIEEASKTDKLIHIIDPENIEKKDYHTKRGAKSYHYTADSVPDFAFSVSDNYLWDGTSVIVDSSDNRRVMVMASYAEGTSHFDSVAAIGQKAIRHMSFSSYGIPYPFPQITVFCGEGGMEYPMIVNDGASFLYEATQFVTMHEIAHAYFPFLTGINERVYSWMDEGLTTFLPIETEKAFGSSYYSIEHVVTNYNRYAGSFNDVPLYVSAINTRNFAYQVFSYLRACTAFSMLETYMGRDQFRSAIRQFVSIWQYKHPTGYDLFAVLKNNSEKDLNWMIDTWFFGVGYADQELDWVTINENNIRLQVLNKGSMPAPLLLRFKYEDGKHETIELSAEIWKEKNRYIYSGQIRNGLESIKLGSGAIPDKYPDNNLYLVK